MSAISRKTALIFANNYASTPSGVIEGPIGSIAGGSPAYSGDPAVIQGANWLYGWPEIVAGTNQPPIQSDTAIKYVLSYLLAYLHQRGIAEWDSSGGTSYYLNCFVSRASGGGAAQVYRCRVTGPVTSDPLTDTTSWISLANDIASPGSAKAWVSFNGNTGSVFQAYGLSSLVQNSTGSYTANFSTAFGSTPVLTGCGGAGILFGSSPGTASFGFETLGQVGGTFVAQNYPYVSVAFFGN